MDKNEEGRKKLLNAYRYLRTQDNRIVLNWQLSPEEFSVRQAMMILETLRIIL
jgi:hypothetical protein